MLNKKLLIAVIILFVCGLMITSLRSASTEEDNKVKRVEKGLRFNVPEDWPVEERNGVVAPVPVEEYLESKFKDITSQLESIKQDLSSKFQEAKQDISSLKDEISEKLKQMKSDAQAKEPQPEDVSMSLDSIISRFNSVEKSLGGLSEELRDVDYQDKSINSQLNDMEIRIKQLESELEDIKEKLPKEEESWY
jgi:peptidoglycan hydrolase CwlO-like protein